MRSLENRQRRENGFVQSFGIHSRTEKRTLSRCSTARRGVSKEEEAAGIKPGGPVEPPGRYAA
jgi:hypothetical protein